MDNSKEVITRLLGEYQALGTWEEVANKYGVKNATINALCLKGKVPKNKSIRAKLGIKNNKKRYPVWAKDKDEQIYLLECRMKRRSDE